MKVTFLLHSAYGMGGTIRCNLILANYLAARHDVEVVTVLRRRDEPFFPVDPRVRMRSLMDVRKGQEPGLVEAWLAGRESRLIPRYDRGREVTLCGDVRLLQFLRGFRRDVLVTTRGGYNVLAARFAPRRTVTVGREHLNFGIHSDHMLARISRWYPRLDAVITQTESDRADYACLLADTATRIASIPAELPPQRVPRSSLDQPVIVAAGRLAPVKRYDRLITAFAKMKAACPDWTLRIYGDGPLRKDLAKHAESLGVTGSVRFLRAISDIESALTQASILAVSSEHEGFGRTIIEAFGCGVPVVSFDCPRGPKEIITSGHDGVLVPAADVTALSAALTELASDEGTRRRLGANAFATSRRYSIETVGEKWETLLAGLVAARRHSRQTSLSRTGRN